MARFVAVFAVLIVFAAAVYGQCDGVPSASYASLLDSSKSVVIDASKVATITGVFKVDAQLGTGSGTLGIEVAKNAGWKVTPTPGLVTVSKSVVTDAASQLGAANILVTVALAALALVSQRGSLVALAIVFAVATVALAGCATNNTVDVTALVAGDIAKVSFKFKSNPATKACDSITVDGALKAEVKTIPADSTGICTLEWTNAYVDCPNECRSTTLKNVASTSCVNKECVLTCTGDNLNCDKAVANGCEGLKNALDNCGAVCGSPKCSETVLNADDISCNAGECTYGSCKTGFDDCNTDKSDGCEAAVGGATACGSCTNDCTKLANVDAASATCNAAQQCEFTCNAGFEDCDNTKSSGCEADLSKDTTCGACGVDCTDLASNNAVSGVCNASKVCEFTCKTNFDDCNPLQAGCETDVSSDATRCGACNNDCTSLPGVDGATTTCDAGKCVISCATGRADCNQDPSDGCEVVLSSNLGNCGACKNDCAALPNLESPVCTNGVCEGTCKTGTDNCSPNKGIGCPSDVSTDAANCGVCGNTCKDVLNAQPKCVAGKCDIDICNTGFQSCDADGSNGCESNKNTDNLNCAACGTKCNIGPNIASSSCTAGVCDVSCLPGFNNCDKDYKTGCEINTNTDVQNCGTCGKVCSLPQTSSYKCNTGVCEALTCNTGFATCTTSPTLGCTIDLNKNADNCKTCGNKCSTLPNVAPGITCSGGVCQTSAAGACRSGFNDCDGNVANGCELATSICGLGGVGTGSRCNLAAGYPAGSPLNGLDCSAITGNVLRASCAPASNASGAVAGQCFVVCQPGFSNCNGDFADGCEAQNDLCDSSQTSGSCDTSLKDKNQPVNCLALATDPELNQTVVQGPGLNVCDRAAGGTGLCKYQCDAAWFDCDGSAINGCEINKKLCQVATAADCVFNKDTRCGSPDCVDCTKISGVAYGTSTCQPIGPNGAPECDFVCPEEFCKNADGDWSNGCEEAQGYAKTQGGFPIDCSKDIDLTNVIADEPIECDGNAGNSTAGFCLFECKPGWADCDDSPLNGCETNVDGPCTSCNFQADVSCGKNKCVDCTMLEGTLLVDYANGRDAAASASTCMAVNSSLGERLTDYYCDTSVHYLNPRFDPPNGLNGACQSELCRDLDENWENGCESAQGYGRGRFYFYGDEDNLDTFMVPYVPNPYEERFNTYKVDYVMWDPTASDYVYKYVEDIKILNLIETDPTSSLDDVRDYMWEEIVGEVQFLESGVRVAPFYVSGDVVSDDSDLSYTFDSDAEEALSSTPLWGDFLNTVAHDDERVRDYKITGRHIALLHYTVEDFTDVIDPADAAELAIIGEPYETPVDCVLSEWSDWGNCAYADDCIEKDYFLQSRIRTREVVTPASGGGVCHLPLVEDFYRFMHRASSTHNQEVIQGFNYVAESGSTSAGNYGTDFQHGGGFSYRIDYTNQAFSRDSSYFIFNVLFWGPNDWNVEDLQDDSASWDVNDPVDLSWTGGVRNGTNNNTADNTLDPDAYARLMTCTAVGTCPDTNDNIPKAACQITAWSEWSRCSAECDGDWAGGVRIRTRTVISGAAALGECFETEFDKDNGLPLVDNAGMLYEEDWQCNDHSCSSYNCTLLRTPTPDQHIYLGADGIWPVCDGRDWPEYVKDIAWVDANRDGWDDNNRWGWRNDEPRITGGNFPLWNTIYNFSYEYRWPGHCLYECEEGWFDCDHDPSNGCEVDGDKCSIDAEFGSTAQLSHPILPWEHPHGDCTLAWKHDKSGVIARDCTDFVERFDELDHTVGLCVPETGLCSDLCEEGYANCEGDGCVSIIGDEDYCGYACVDCKQLNKFRYGYAEVSGKAWDCVENDDEDDWVCEPVAEDCLDGCEDNDDDFYNGCETATYQQWPYPDVERFNAQMTEWSAWTQCTHSDECGYLWDLEVGVFRHVPIQTRSRHPTKSAYNGGWYPEFSYNGRDWLEIDGVIFPEDTADLVGSADDAFDPDFGSLTEQPDLEDILGIPLVQTPFYEVRVCPTMPQPCIECTNQLEGLEEHCVLSEWSDWSACTAECMDRIQDPEYLGTTLDDVESFREWDLDYSYYVTDRTPYQIRSRTVVKPARRGGRCPPPGDTWQLAEAASHVELNSYNEPNNDDLDAPWEGGLVDDLATDNTLMSAKASYLVDVRKCNTDKCEYPEDCDALNYWYPGHFETIATCRTSTTYYELSRCVAEEGDQEVWDKTGCNAWNGYCDDVNSDLRDGCDTYVYPTHCGRVDDESGNNECDYDYFRDCTTLPGMISPFAAPCVLDQYNGDLPLTVTYDSETDGADWEGPNCAGLDPEYKLDGDAVTDTECDTNYGGTSFAKPNAPNATQHICDIRWACNATACSDESFGINAAEEGWMDGCEVARNYRYPFVTVDTAFEYIVDGDTYTGNPIDLFFEMVDTLTDVQNTDQEGTLVKDLFWDRRNLYNLDPLDLPQDRSIEFSFDCQSFFSSQYYCGHSGDDDYIKEPVLWEGEILDEDGDVESWFPLNEGCHLRGLDYADEFEELGFGCNGVWRAGDRTFGTCTMKCAAGYFDADLDPRNGCETDTIAPATPEDKYIWVGNCQASNGAVQIQSVNSCGADLCVDCSKLPGTAPTGVLLQEVANCTLVEETTNAIPVLAGPEDYYSIQYACGVLTAQGFTVYEGEVDFDDWYCNKFCADGDGDWTNGCEQGRGYTDGSIYEMGAAYDEIFDFFNYETLADTACDPDWINAGANPCDQRSSGFEYPVPGAWFYQNFTSLTGDDDALGLESYEAEYELSDFLDDLTIVNSLLSAANPSRASEAMTEVQALNKRGFDCSLLFSTELMFDADEEYIPLTDSENGIEHGIRYRNIDTLSEEAAIYTFAEVHHIDVTRYKWNNPNGVCNRTTGMCQYECEAGWADYDEDPSNGCEADLSGPCGLPLPRTLQTYRQAGSCGEYCVNCQKLPGTYQLPFPKSECLKINPANYVDENKADYVLRETRFVHACVTEVIRPPNSDLTKSWRNIVCDPLACFDANFDYEDGCELAVDYPIEWYENGKAAFNHWVSPIPATGGAHTLPETTYWLRDDGFVTIGRSRTSGYTTDPNGFITIYRAEEEPTDNTYDHWVELFDLTDSEVGVYNGEFDEEDLEYTLLDAEDRTDFYFGNWDVRDVPGYTAGKWYLAGVDADPDATVNGYGYFPYPGDETGTYDCSNAELPSGTDWVPISNGTPEVVKWVEVDWTLTTSMAGPWFHVNQSAFATTGCNAGYDPAANRDQYGRTTYGPVINPFDYCWTVTRGSGWDSDNYNKACFDAWVWPGAGLCKLDCERGWADRDADPTNGCESFLANGFPMPRSRCGTQPTAFDDPATFNLTSPNYNFNQDEYCGAGYCMSCVNLGGVNHAPGSAVFGGTNTVGGTRAFCRDGGDDWIAADGSGGSASLPTPTNAVAYPSDYYCAGVINQNACLRAQLRYTCRDPNDQESCPNGFLWGRGPNTNTAGTQTNGTTQFPNIGYARYFQVCEDRDDLWQTGCEIALGYNIGWNTSVDDTTIINEIGLEDEDGDSITLEGTYDRSVGVKPNWNWNFEVISWDTSVSAGFDCEILRLLPREHTHITPQFTGSNVIECALNGRGKERIGTCSYTCDNFWSDCDGNPWNGCEQSTLLCSGSGATACEDPQRYPVGKKPTASCDALPSANVEFARTAFCDGNQLPYDDWYDYFVEDEDGWNYDDEGEYDEIFEIYDHGLNHVTILTDKVDPEVSRYTIKGYWDNDDIDYSCRVWLDFYNFTNVRLRTQNISADANFATGRCVVDCDEAGGYSDCNGLDGDGCEIHTQSSSCRSPSGECISCVDLPGVATVSSSKCLSTIGAYQIRWPTNAQGLTGAYVSGSSGPTQPGSSTTFHVVSYGDDEPINSEFPQCDTRGAIGSGSACADNLCRDYDNDWENGCEFPMQYTSAERLLWETEGALYNPSGEVVDGFDCSWISDPQPDAGGRNYDGMTWAQKFHVDLTVKKGYCKGSAGGNAGKCDFNCAAGWEDCDKDPTNGCETDQTKCESCVFALRYPDRVKVNCTTLVEESLGFVPFEKAPVCKGREDEDGQCAYYFCNIFEGFCDSGLGAILSDPSKGCVNMSLGDNQYCGADWNWRDIRGNESTVDYDITVDEDDEVTVDTEDYEGGQMLDYSNFDGTGRCASCHDLNGYMSEDAYCEYDPTISGHTFDFVVYYKPAAGGWIDNSLGNIEFNTAGNTVGDYLCQLHGALGADDDGACDRNLCVDEDYYWANGCETAVNYNHTHLSNGTAGSNGADYESQRHLRADDEDDWGFDYHFAFNDEVFGRDWPYNPNIDGNSVQKNVEELERNEIRGIWCPFLQFWSLSTDNYDTGDCDVFPCPHLSPETVDTWITCVNNASLPNAGKCNFICNTNAGWEDCDQDPMTGCETDIFNDGTCGSECQRIECNTLAGLNPFYWSECLQTAEGSHCDLSICNDWCKDEDGIWENGCEVATNYPNGKKYDCLDRLTDPTLHLATVEQCNGEPGNHWEGKCEFTCEPGWVDCNEDFEDGCEHDGSLCQDCTKALGYVTYFDGADMWENWGAANRKTEEGSREDMFYKVVYGSRFDQDSLDFEDYDLVENATTTSRGIQIDTFEGPNPSYSKFHHAFVAAFDCESLRTTYPGHFTATAIRCDSNANSATAGRCVYECNAGAGYFDCDGDPRNGCEHSSQHTACGSNGACRDCFYISGVDYPVDDDFDGLNDGAQGPYVRGAFGVASATRVYNDVYDEKNVTYFSVTGSGATLQQSIPDRFISPLRIGCVKLINSASTEFSCNLWSCEKVDSTYCVDENQGKIPAPNGNRSWLDGCERALSYDFNNTAAGKYFDCSLMGPDFINGDKPRATNIPNTPSFHVRQKVGTNGCDSHNVTADGHPFEGKGAWRYILAREGRVDDYDLISGEIVYGDEFETEGEWAFDYEGIENYFRLNSGIDVLDLTVEDFVIWRVRGDDKIGTCYYECEYGYDDCNGDPRDGCEILLSACADRDGEIGWDWERRIASNGCETALGYTREELGITDQSDPEFNCAGLKAAATELHVNGTLPIYCRGGQDGNLLELGTCQFTCETGWQDCNGDPTDGCEDPIDDNHCGECIDCVFYLPGTLPKSDNLDLDEGAQSQSVCVRNATSGDYQCTVPCNATLCEDRDGDWTNGCEVALAYPTPRGAEPIPDFDCSVWSKPGGALKAKKEHIDIDLLDKIYCEGRWNTSNAGQCNYQGACLLRSAGSIHDWQDCDSDPRNGCEDTNRWCQIGQAQSSNPYGTNSDLCSKALNYYCDANGFDARGELCDDDLLPQDPSFDCFELGLPANAGRFHVLTTGAGVLYPYCDRDVTHLETRGECIFTCEVGWEDCNEDARDGCEANVTEIKTCDYDCINCQVLPGIDRDQPYNCVADPVDTLLKGTPQYKCLYTCAGGASSTNCRDVDGEWQNGCEVALNIDTDDDGVFVNAGDDMDCSVMQEEAVKNPDLFRHHLHIDLEVEIPTLASNADGQINLPAGSIFCNEGLVAGWEGGKCYFACIEGFFNENRKSFDGCEKAVGDSLPAYPYTYGGFMIGDYEVEEFLEFLIDFDGTGVTMPRNLEFPFVINVVFDNMHDQFSLLHQGLIIWY